MEKFHFPSSEKPNFTSVEAENAEKNLDTLIEQMEILGFSCIETKISPEILIKTAKKFVPERLALVERKLKGKNFDLENMDSGVILDKLYGVDKIIQYGGRTFFIDVTTAKTTAIRNKINKFKELEELLRSIGCDHAVILSLRKNDVSEDAAIKFAEILESASEFIIDVRLHNL